MSAFKDKMADDGNCDYWLELRQFTGIFLEVPALTIE